MPSDSSPNLFSILYHKIRRNVLCAFDHRRRCARQSKNMRDNLSERQLDKTVRDSFPASDPPSTY